MELRSGGSLQSLRRTNREHLLGLLLQFGPVHRAELARRAEVSRTTVSTIINDLIDRGIVVESEQANGDNAMGNGRQLLRVNPTAGAAAGMDFAYDHVWVHVIDLGQRELASAGAQIPADDPRLDKVEAGIALLDRLLGEVGLDRNDLVGIGIGIPGPIRVDTGEVDESIPNLWAGANAAEELSSRLGIPVYIENNIRLEAVAEATWGSGRGVQNMLYVGLSSGIAASLVLDGQLYRGAIGSAGELGHVSVNIDGPACPCGNRGCLVLYAGARAVLETLRPRLGDDATIGQALQAAAEGDRACVGVLTDVGQIVGWLLANICNLLNPQRLVIGGDLARAGDMIVDAIHAQIRRYALSLNREVDVRVAEISPHERSGALGGSALVIREIPRLSATLAALAN